ncbi:BON domain-containing protein [Schlegelella sp. S2-27]|uniref:BON domain-containing protein n=1 Tax=Caldimonas mangrovi TaxID=2944811 RepID=A0ABT0YJU5_9BURK|nr:BON domain-containing protein [Caldimonas mangrovi]MCM5678998.1 BON domain-containing protein [Caldimonas mangrovi]
MKAATVVGLLLAALAAHGADEPGSGWRLNPFGDPFVQATQGLPGCPVPRGPAYDAAGMRQEAHQRAERGTTCWLEKKCAEPNAYRYDAGIAERALEAVRADARFDRSSVWITVQRRFIYLEGCVASAAQGVALEQAMQGVADVDRVLPLLITGTRAPPPYPVTGKLPP